MTIEELDGILTKINYYDIFKNVFLNKSYNSIDYGTRQGIKKFNSFFDAKDKYSYSNQLDEGNFTNWTNILNDDKSTAEDLLITCLEIFDWGNVLTGNVKIAVNLYKANKLKSYISWIKSILSSKTTIETEEVNSAIGEIVWSSGWTKVYSFINNDILIYDSRVSAFINHTLVHNRVPSDEFSSLSNMLFNFAGAKDRKRKVDNTFGFKNQHPKGLRGFNANLVSSWIFQLLNEKLSLNCSIRDYERALFMLGFDLKQIEN